MTRANRLSKAGHDGGIFHLTHRCHNHTFLLKFARDRDAYRTKLREHLLRFKVSILDYCVTCNHVHLLVDAAERVEVSGLMQQVASEMARAYNRRKGRCHAFWGDNYHASLIEDGPYLWRCLCYIELNMVRCGVVSHPSGWEWTGYHEIMGQRRRYRLLDLDRLCWRLRVSSIAEIRENLAASLSEKIARDAVKREPCWTESLAVGSRVFLEQVRPFVLTRRETEITEMANESMWALQESTLPYGLNSGLKITRKAIN
jgi:putative transposase